MIDTQTTFNLTTKQLNFLRLYSAQHKTSIGDTLRQLIDQLQHDERMKEINHYGSREKIR
jgi:hypothetical protein